MLSRFKCLLAMLAVSSGFSIAAHADTIPAPSDNSNNSIAIVSCFHAIGYYYPDADVSPDDVLVYDVSPEDFAYIQDGDNCALALAKAKHYGWNVEFSNDGLLEVRVYDPELDEYYDVLLEGAIYTLIKP